MLLVTIAFATLAPLVLAHPTSSSRMLSEAHIPQDPISIGTSTQPYSASPTRDAWGSALAGAATGYITDHMNACFDGATLFQTRDGNRRADQLRVGDSVLAADTNGQLVWDTIAVDASHGGGSTTFVEIETATGQILHISPNHYLHAAPHAETAGCCGSATLKLASEVKVGETVWTVGGSLAAATINDNGLSLTTARVVRVSTVLKEGMYNFLLAQSATSPRFRSIVASGVVASSFTSNWRLLELFGFDAADRLRDPLREMSLMADPAAEGSDSSSYSPRNRLLMGVLEQVENVTANCIEDHLQHGCTEAELMVQFAVIEAEARETLAPEMHTAVATLLERLAARHLSVLPRSARRLVAATLASMSTSDVVVSLVAHEVHLKAVEICKLDDGCQADMPAHVATVPKWALVCIATLSIILMVIVLVTTIAILLLLRRLQRSRAKADTAPPPAATSTATGDELA